MKNRDKIHPELRDMFVDHKNRICRLDKDTGELIPYRFLNPRPRPLMFVGWRNGKKVYVRKQSLSYFQLKQKYPPPRNWDKILKPRHVFREKHYFAHKLEEEHIWGYIMAACGIAAFASLVIFYLYLLSKGALL